MSARLWALQTVPPQPLLKGHWRLQFAEGDFCALEEKGAHLRRARVVVVARPRPASLLLRGEVGLADLLPNSSHAAS